MDGNIEVRGDQRDRGMRVREGGGRGRARRIAIISDEIRATVVDHAGNWPSSGHSEEASFLHGQPQWYFCI